MIGRRGGQLVVGLVLIVAAGCARQRAGEPIAGPATIADRVADYGPRARARLRPYFTAAAVGYPPSHIVLVGLKQERQLLVYAPAPDGRPRWILRYPVLAASGRLGPKLMQGDRQVPEGLYRIESLNPNSRFHLSLRIDYPNAFDVERAAIDARDDLGGDIMIHGSAVSIGCIAVGDEAAEDLFVLVADVGVANVDVILSPIDFRVAALPRSERPAWVEDLYAEIRRALTVLPPPPI